MLPMDLHKLSGQDNIWYHKNSNRFECHSKIEFLKFLKNYQSLKPWKALSISKLEYFSSNSIIDAAIKEFEEIQS